MRRDCKCGHTREMHYEGIGGCLGCQCARFEVR